MSFCLRLYVYILEIGLRFNGSKNIPISVHQIQAVYPVEEPTLTKSSAILTSSNFTYPLSTSKLNPPSIHHFQSTSTDDCDELKLDSEETEVQIPQTHVKCPFSSTTISMDQTEYILNKLGKRKPTSALSQQKSTLFSIQSSDPNESFNKALKQLREIHQSKAHPVMDPKVHDNLAEHSSDTQQVK